MKPLCIDLFCGLGGWTEGFLAEGWDVVGFDIEQHVYGEHRYPAQLVLQDVRTLTGNQFKGKASVIVASPPCQEYSYMAMPWSRAKQIAREYRDGTRDVAKLTELFDECFRIAEEAELPLIVENVRGAQPWVGRAKFNFGSFYLWGDVPALMPFSKRELKGFGGTWFHNAELGTTNPNRSRAATLAEVEGRKNNGGSWFNIAHNTLSGCGNNPDGRKTVGHANIRDGYSHTRHLTNQRESDALRACICPQGCDCESPESEPARCSEHCPIHTLKPRPVEDCPIHDVGRKVPGFNFHEHEKTGKPGRSFQSSAVEGLKQPGISGVRENGKGDRWFQDGAARHGSKSSSRKAASALIAKIPMVLSRHIAKAYHP